MHGSDSREQQEQRQQPQGLPKRVALNEDGYYANCTMVQMTPFDTAILFGKIRPATDANGQGHFVEMYDRQVYLSHLQARALQEGLGRSRNRRGRQRALLTLGRNRLQSRYNVKAGIHTMPKRILMKTQLIVVIAAWWLALAVVLALQPGFGLAGTAASLNEQLREAASRADLGSVKVLLDKGANINARDRFGVTALKNAVDSGGIDVVKMLLDSGADPNARLNDDSTILMWAALRGQAQVVKLLLDQGSAVNAKAKDGSTALLWAGVSEHADVVDVLTAHGAEVTLPVAALLGDMREVRRLLQAGANINANDEKGWTPLMNAAQKGHAKVVKLLLNNGADVTAKRPDGSTAFMDAVGNSQIEVIKLLLKTGTDVAAERALMHAATWGKPALLQLLWDNVAGLSEKQVDKGMLLVRAAGWGHPNVVKLLLEKGADIDAKDELGQSALVAAASRRHLAVVKLLLDRSAAVDSQLHGETALEIAAIEGYKEIAALLLDKTDKDRKISAFNAAAKHGHADVVRVFLDKGVDVNAANRYGSTALMGAVEGGHLTVVETLLNRGADVNAKSKNGKTALIIGATAIRRVPVPVSVQLAVVKLLLESGADVKAKDANGMTALLWASKGHKPIADLLREYGAQE